MNVELQTKILAGAQTGGQFHAILCCIFGVEKAAPCFEGTAIVTSDGFLMANFTDRNGDYHHGAFVGSASDLDRNVAGISQFLKLTADETSQLEEVVTGWIGQDYRDRRGARS